MMRWTKSLALLLILIAATVSVTVAQTPAVTEPASATAEATGAEAVVVTEPVVTAEATTATTAVATEAATVDAGASKTEAAATEAAPLSITLVPFSDPGFGIQGVVPEGWKAISAGIYARTSVSRDSTLIAQQAAPGAAETVLNSLLPQLALKTPPPVVGTYTTDFATWNLYRVDVPVSGITVSVDLALAQVRNTTYLVLVQGASPDYAALHEQLFIPALDAFARIAATPPPSDYRSETVKVTNGDVTLAGTLTMPNGAGPFPGIVLVSGSGPQNRDEVLGSGIQIAPFALIADSLTRAGMAVLRYDDRGVADSSGDFASATTQDFASDAKAVIAYLATRPEIDAAQIGMLGHSEGGLVGAMLGANDSTLDFVILMAGPAVDGKSLLDVQNRRLMEVEGATSAQVADQVAFLHRLYPLIDKGDVEGVRALIYQQVLDQAKALPAEQLKTLGNLEDYAHQTTDQLVTTYGNDWFKSFLNYDPGPDLAKIDSPVLALFGGKDVQVDAGQNAPAMTSRLIEGGNRDFSVVVLPDANHLFQQADTGSLTEYATLPPAFTPDFLPTIVNWLSLHVTLKPSS